MKRTLLLAGAVTALLLAGCSTQRFDPSKIAEGPGQMVGNNDPITNGIFTGSNDGIPAPAPVPDGGLPNPNRPPNCDAKCVAYCQGLNLQNPVNQGLCYGLWGVGLPGTPVDPTEACRRMFIDMVGRVPTLAEIAATCQGDWGATARTLMADRGFILVNQRRAADTFLYSTDVVNVSRIYDMDDLVRKLYQGRVPYDLFASVAASDPVLTRRYTSPGDMVDANFRQFLGRVPYQDERADMARLFAQWGDSYVDHPQLNIRVPDGFIQFPCANAQGQIDPNLVGLCTSTLWGFHPLAFAPDIRATMDSHLNQLTTWSGLLTPQEWSQLETPGLILTGDRAFWEKAVSDVLVQYLGYDLSQLIPQVRQSLVNYFLSYNGDIRALHFAVVTSAPYLMSHNGAARSSYRWTTGPFKQMEAEVWLKSLAAATGVPLGDCDFRLTDPDAMLKTGSVPAYQLIAASRWSFDSSGNIDHAYSDLAGTLGGCPDNMVSGRFNVVSILTTVTQLNFVNTLCNPQLDTTLASAPAALLLPGGVGPTQAVDGALAQSIADFQYRNLLGRAPTSSELTDALNAGTACASAGSCTAEQFARPFCFALLSSADALFY